MLSILQAKHFAQSVSTILTVVVMTDVLALLKTELIHYKRCVLQPLQSTVDL
jgi:hypothetical protein